MGDPFFKDIVVDGNTKLFPEDSGKIIFVDKVTLGQLVQRYFFCVILIQITADLHQVFFLSVGLLEVRMPAFFQSTRGQVPLNSSYVPDSVYRYLKDNMLDKKCLTH